MALENVYTIAGMMSIASVWRDIKSQTINPNVTKFLLGGSGTGFNTFAAINQITPVIDFGSGDIKRILAAMTNQIALAIDGDFYIWFQKITEGGVRASGANHYKGTIAKGMVIPVSLRLSDGQPAELTCQIILTSADGVTTSMSLTATQTLVAAAGAAEGWTLGPVNINGTTLEGVKEVTINFGITPVVEGSSGMVFKTFCGVMTIAPSITIVADSIDNFLAWGFTGAAQGATDSTIEVQDLAEGGVRGSSPIICTIDDALWTTDNVTSADGQPCNHGIRADITYDGVALPLAWTGLT